MLVKQIDNINDENGIEYDEYLFKKFHQILVLINENYKQKKKNLKEKKSTPEEDNY